MDETIPPELSALLQRFHIDEVPLDALRASLRGTPDPESMHRITEPVSPPPESAATTLPPAGSPEESALRARGEEAIRRGELATVVLSGGMATRFGAVVKGLAEMSEGSPARFLDAKIADVDRARRLWGPVDLTLMTSFATHDAIAGALEALGRTDVHLAPQFVSLRLTAAGELFRTPSGALSPHAPGHGDLPRALAVHGALARLRAAGVRTVLVSNVDNVGATIDPALFGLHQASGARITVELVGKHPGDKGGLPVERNGRLVLAEAFRLPKGFPADAYPLFNTNTLWIDLDALEAPARWTWCVARKKVEGAEALQMERLVGEMTWWHPAHYVHVPRDGADSRFIPVKDLDDLARQHDQIAAVLRGRLGMTD